MASLESLFRDATDGACGVNRQQRVVLWNRSAETLLGYAADEVLGRRCFEVLRSCDEHGHDVCQRNCPIFRMTEQGGAAPTAILRAADKSGDPVWLSVSTLAVPSRWNNDAVLVHLFRDVSHLKRCEIAVDNLLADMRPSADDGGTRTAVAPVPAACLTARESEVLRLLSAGRSTREIAETLFVSASTVRNHVHNILAKLGVHSRLEAVTVALRFGLV
jgi:PAS domain S-box-containing protein